MSYADPGANHQGTIYRAGSWIEDGRTDQERKTPRFDYTADSNPEPSLFGELRPRLVKYSRASHVPSGVAVQRVPRGSKFRFVYWLDGKHEDRRKASQANTRAVGGAFQAS